MELSVYSYTCFCFHFVRCDPHLILNRMGKISADVLKYFSFHAHCLPCFPNILRLSNLYGNLSTGLFRCVSDALRLPIRTLTSDF